MFMGSVGQKDLEEISPWKFQTLRRETIFPQHLQACVLWVVNGFSCEWYGRPALNQVTPRKCEESFSVEKFSIIFNIQHPQFTQL